MKLTSLKALSAGLIAAGLLSLGFIAPAQAASLLSPTATATGTIGTSAKNTYPITVSATTVSTQPRFVIELPTGWTPAFFGGPTCGSITYTGVNILNTGCNVTGNVITLYNSDGSSTVDLASGTAVTVTFPVNSLNVASARVFTLGSSNSSGTMVDSATATLGGGSTSSPTSTSSASTDPGLAATGSDNTGAIVLGAGFLMAGLVALAGVQVLRRRKNV